MDFLKDLMNLKCYHRAIFDKLTDEKHVEMGTLTLKKMTPHTFTLIEHGKFKASRYQNKTFNYYQWHLTAQQQLQLRHLRYQKNNGVLLATFYLKSKVPILCSPYFYCGQDCYQAQLRYTEKEFILSWLIKGPKKNLFIKTNYHGD